MYICDWPAGNNLIELSFNYVYLLGTLMVSITIMSKISLHYHHKLRIALQLFAILYNR